MDISCIISSGDLELYVLGMLSQEDNEKVAQLAQMFPEIKKEIDDIEQALLQMSDGAEETDVPSPSVKDNLFAKLRALKQEEQANMPANNYIEPKQETKVISMSAEPRRNMFPVILSAASIIGLIICVAIISHLSSANTHYHEAANNLQAQINQVKQKAADEQAALNKSLQLYQSPEYKRINLTPVPGKPDALVQLFWSQTTHDVYVADISLPQAPAGKQYQLWAIVDGKPVDAGMMTSKNMPQKMYAFAKADAFAITLEKTGGNPTPQGEIYVLGKTS